MLKDQIEVQIDRMPIVVAQSSEARTALLASIVDCSGDAIIAKTPEGIITSWNHGAEQIYGYSASEIIGQPVSLLIHPDRPDEMAGILARIRSGERVEHYETVRLRKDGKAIAIALTVSPIYDSEGRLVGASSIARDITERTRAVEKLRAASLYARSLIEASLDPLVTISPQGIVTDVNEATIKVTGIERENLVGTDFSDYFTEPEKAREGYRHVFSNGSLTDYPLTIRHRDGRLTEVLYNASVYKDVRGNVLGVFAAARDVPEIRRLNHELQARVGELTALNQELESFNYSISHDLRAPLRHIDAYTKIVLEKPGWGMPEEARSYLERVGEGARRMGRMVDELLELSRASRREPAKQITGLKSLVEDVIFELKPEVQDRDIEWRIGALPFADCDPALTRQVFANLLSNAVKFSRSRKPAVIEVGQIWHEGQPVLFVRDNGEGFSMKYADKLFGVFQRLHRREEFEGTGVGLVTVQRIIHKHGGRIWVEAELDKGATFYFTLDSPGEPRPGSETEGAEVVAGGRQC